MDVAFLILCIIMLFLIFGLLTKTKTRDEILDKDKNEKRWRWQKASWDDRGGSGNPENPRSPFYNASFDD